MYVLDEDLLEVSFTGPEWYTYVFSPVHDLGRIPIVWKTLTRLAEGQIMPTVYSWLLVDKNS